MDYTEAQRAAIGTLDDPLLIVACAGSGKTQVISQRIIETLRRPDIEPKNIVAFTFTDKAAAWPRPSLRNGSRHWSSGSSATCTGWPRCSSAPCTATRST